MAKVKIQTNLENLYRAWEENDPDAILSGMTLAQFKSATAPALASREKLRQLRQDQRSTIATRTNADVSATLQYLQVVNAIKGSELHGENSAFYRALGYKTRNERISGLTRKAAPEANGTNP